MFSDTEEDVDEKREREIARGKGMVHTQYQPAGEPLSKIARVCV